MTEQTIYQQYTNITGLFPTGYTVEKIDDAKENGFSEDEIIMALRRSKEQGKTNWPYIEAVMRNNRLKPTRNNQMSEAYDLFMEQS